MGRCRRRRNNRGRKKQQFRSNYLASAIEDDSERERYKEEQKKHLKNVAELKQDLLSRTVLVGSVLPLSAKKNKEALRMFMELQYGPVQRIGVDKKGGRKFPRGRVTFNYKKDAEMIFDGLSLVEAAKGRTQVKVLCASVGHKGSITIRPSPEYKGIAQDDLNTSSTIQVNTKSCSLGHWFPQGKDACVHLPGFEATEKNQTGTWVEENATTVNPIICINMESAVIELDVTSSISSSISDFPFLFGRMDEVLGIQRRVILSFRFKDLAHPMELCRCKRSVFNPETFYIVYALNHPPRLSSIEINLETGWESRTRLTDIEDGGSSAIPGVGLCLGYRLEVSSVEIKRMLNAKAFVKLKKMGLFRCEDEMDLPQQAELVSIEKAHSNSRQRLDARIASLSRYRLRMLLLSILDSQSCSWFDMLNNKVVGQDLVDLVKGGDGDMMERLLGEMKGMHGRTRYPAQMLQYLYEVELELDEAPRPVPEFCVSLPRILITPCRLCVTGFEVEMSNRLVRKFIENIGFSDEAFIRVSIGDENGDKLFSDDISEKVEARIKDLTLNGFVLVKKKYQFLAYSSSQLKEQSVWMVCPERGWSVSQMAQSMGDFSSCKTPAKYAARMGQCFSTTVDTSLAGTESNGCTGVMGWTKQKLGFLSSNRGASSHGLRVKDDLPDITSYNTKTCMIMDHSDGVGLIRKEALKDIVKRIPFGPKYKAGVSAIQIRYGGAKGVLMAWDFAKLQHCNGYDVCLRPSMVKFKAPYDRLEVITVANKIPYYLNRNVILLGSYHGITNQTFQSLQANHLDNLNNMLVDASFAERFLPQLSGADSGLMATLRYMLVAGLKPHMDPFLYSALHSIRSHHLMNLRKKARIHVEDGAVLIGGIDELGLIPENCVFVQVKRPADRKAAGSQKRDDYMVVKGHIMVTKHPVMHPGDMRMLQAVDIPELRDHRNVILFSQYGERPEADKMSGSDLDGDQFAITWDKRLFLNSTSLPMDYSPPTKPSESDSITNASLIGHFINHLRNDNLGRIAMLWMDHAVKEKDAGCPACLELAKLASIAVDFPKSGVPATIPKNLIIPSKAPRAHWRERKSSSSFHCESIMGKLYDRIIDEQHTVPHAASTSMAGRYRDKNGQILYLGDRRALSNAKENIYNPVIPQRLGWKRDKLDDLLLGYADHQRYLYESQLYELMNQYKIKCEGEVTTGCILKYHKLHKRRRHDVSEEVRRQFSSIRKTFRSEFLTALHHLVQGNLAFFENTTDDDIEDDVAEEQLDWIEDAATGAPASSVGEEAGRKVKRLSCRLAAAHYITTYHPDMHEDGSKSVLYSFPWVVAADVIARGVNEGSS